MCSALTLCVITSSYPKCQKAFLLLYVIRFDMRYMNGYMDTTFGESGTIRYDIHTHWAYINGMTATSLQHIQVEVHFYQITDECL